MQFWRFLSCCTFLFSKTARLDGELVKVTYGANDAFNYSLTAEQLLKHGVFGYVYLEPSEVPGKMHILHRVSHYY